MQSFTSFSPPDASALVLGLAAGPHTIVAVGGQGRDLLLVARGKMPFERRNSSGRGLRGALVRGDAEVWVCGEYGHVARSDDGGRTFEKVGTGLTSGCMFGVVEDKDGTVWVAGDSGYIARSTDGQTLKRVSGVKESIGRIRAAEIGILIPTDDGHLFIGEGKKIRPTSLEAGVMLMAAMQTRAGTLVTVGKGGGVWRSDDGGESWTQTQTERNVLLCGVAQMQDGRIAVVGFAGTILISDDEAKSFALCPQNLESDALWCAESFGPGILVGCPQSQVALLGEAGALEPAPAIAVPVVDESAMPSHWRTPALSTEKQEWSPPPRGVVETENGVYVSDWLRRALYPRRGGIPTDPRPLPTTKQAWSSLRRALWAADNANIEDGNASGIWERVTSSHATTQKLGERILDDAARVGEMHEDVALVSLSLARYRTFIKQYQPLVFEHLADFLVASVGLSEACRRLITGLDDELPYVGVGPFGRLRELLVLADETDFRAARDTIVEVTRHEVTAARRTNDRDRTADLQWAATFLLPLGPGTDEVERELHANAMENVGEFGNFCVHACGLAAGDHTTLQRFLDANKKVRHEFFSPFNNRVYLASVLEIAGRDAGEILAKMKPASPFADDALRNGLWSMLLAHVDDPEARMRLVEEHRARTAWGTAGLRLAHAFAADAVREIAGDEEALRAPLDPAQYDHSVADVGEMARPTSYQPPPSIGGQSAAPPDAPEVALQWRDEERIHASGLGIYPDAVKWNGESIASLDADGLHAFLSHRERWAIPSDFCDLALTPAVAQSRLRALGFKFSSYWCTLLPKILLRSDVDGIPVLLAALQDAGSYEGALRAALVAGDVRVGRFFVEAFAGKKYKALAREWILRHPDHARFAALAAGADKSAPVRAAAARVLRFVEPSNTTLDAHIKPKKVTLPGWASASSLPPLVATNGTADVDALLLALAKSMSDEPSPLVSVAREQYTSASLADFAWALFDAWLNAGAENKYGWCMQALGFIGDDDGAEKLVGLALGWPHEGASARAKAALDVFVNLNTARALANLRDLSEQAGPAGLRNAASERMHELAVRQGLSMDEFDERTTGTLGLEAEDALDFGPRRLQIEFGPNLEIWFREPDGSIAYKFPRAHKTDDKVLVKAAKARVKELTKAAEPTRARHGQRLERLLRTGREIEPDVFRTAYAEHPWLRSLASRFIWSDGDAFMIGERAPKGPVHLLHPCEVDEDTRGLLDKKLSASSGAQDIAPPFLQLDRPVFSTGDLQREMAPLDDNALQKLMALGWWQTFVDERSAIVSPTGGPPVDVATLKIPGDINAMSPRQISEWAYDFSRAREENE